MIMQAMKFNEFQDCKALLDMLEDSVYVMKYKLEVKFEEMIDWFLRIRMGIATRPIPVYMNNNKKVNLLELYMIVKRGGGHRNVTSNNLWAVLDVIIYYYKFKSVQGDVRDGQAQGNAMNEDKVADEGRRTMSTGCIPEDDREHYALFAGNDWI
ncbi:putative transcription factor & chromatin remodeling ARID family [Helianthus anomalus]